MRFALLAILVLALPGCAELRAPPPATRVPATLGAGSADPLRDAVAQAALAYADGGRSMANNPARMARAAAQVEMMTAEFMRDLRWAPLPAGVVFELRGARVEGRAALGIRANAEPDAVVRALTATHLALLAGDRAAAERALDPALFEPGGAGSLAFLERPGPLPQGRIATALARDEVERLARARVWGLTGALDPQAGWVDPEPGRGLGIGVR
ncbi:hypothetical protein [Falsiroseomonas selenitidurans]|uniref:Lipoprotein n=1 Tax=Falsiroseomonas selenitidurans TaxID=2716335 RepID=A0ABX1E2S7_9PROT|nr:hypothetical protein [Falsiroseomonas selenitidurans]NKC31472.1 hypothetical protein [Falsiroseomonas selenitidurans]